MTNSIFVTVDRARVAYRVQGQGPAIALVNGAGGSDMHWGSVIPQLAAHRTVVTLDYSGTGATTDDGSALSLRRRLVSSASTWSDIRSVRQ